MNNTTITKIDIFKINIPLSRPYRVSYAYFENADNLIVRIHTESGVYGIGECVPGTKVTGDTQQSSFEICQFIAKNLIGKDPLAINERMSELNGYLDYNSASKSAFDMALYDLSAKVAGLPLYAFLGGENRTIITDNTIGIGDPKVMAQAAAQYVEQGFSAVKVKLGTNKDDDVERVKLIRQAIGDNISIRIDANQGWDVTTAIQTLKALEPYNVQYCEEPVICWDSDGLKRVRANSLIPIMADESIHDHHDAFRLAKNEACDYFNIKLAKAGIHSALKINAVGESAGIKCMVGCMDETRLAISAAAHLVSARPNIIFADLDSPLSLSQDPVQGGIVYEGENIIIPDTPGHGADIKSEFIDKLECVTVTA